MNLPWYMSNGLSGMSCYEIKWIFKNKTFYINQFSAKKLMLAGHGVCELPGYELCLKYTYAFN